MKWEKFNKFSFYIWMRHFAALSCSTLIYIGAGFFFLHQYKETLLVSKLYEPSLNFLILTALAQVVISFASCIYLYQKYITKIDKPITHIENYLNDLTKKEVPDTKLKVENTFSNIKQMSLIIKVLVSYWRMEHTKQNSKIIKLQKKTKNGSRKVEHQKSA